MSLVKELWQLTISDICLADFLRTLKEQNGTKLCFIFLHTYLNENVRSGDAWWFRLV